MLVDQLAPLLVREKIAFQEKNGELHIALPYQFGTLVIADLDENDDIIELQNEDWHTHSSCLIETETDSKAEKTLAFLKAVFADQYFLIEEKEPDKEPVRLIEDDLGRYEEYLPEGTAYKVFEA